MSHHVIWGVRGRAEVETLQGSRLPHFSFREVKKTDTSKDNFLRKETIFFES